jgi:hypothetical protein
MYNTLMQSGEDSTPDQEPAEQEKADWQFHDDEGEAQGDQPLAIQQMPAVTWTASEFVSHDKNAGWYMLVIVGSAAIAALVYLITRDVISPIVIVILGISFAAFGARKPRVLEYAIDNTGVHVGSKTYPYGLFKTFSVIEEDAVRSILLMPMQRFNLPISVYYDPADEEKIVEALGAHLPHQDRKPTPIDNFMRKIRF